MNMLEFGQWLIQQMESEELSMRQLANKAGITHPSISRVISGERNPGIEFCQGIARAFRIPQVVVFAKAGLITDLDADLSNQELWQLLKQLTAEQRRYILTVAQEKIKLDNR